MHHTRRDNGAQRAASPQPTPEIRTDVAAVFDGDHRQIELLTPLHLRSGEHLAKTAERKGKEETDTEGERQTDRQRERQRETEKAYKQPHTYIIGAKPFAVANDHRVPVHSGRHSRARDGGELFGHRHTRRLSERGESGEALHSVLVYCLHHH